MNGVVAPMSMAIAPSAIVCEEIRFSSSVITRRYSPRSGTTSPPSFSTASAQEWLAVIAHT